MRNIIIATTALLALSACAQQRPIFYGVNGPRTGFAGMDFAEADARCMHETRSWSMTRPGDPFYNQMAGGQTFYNSCMQGKGFNPQQ